MCNWFPGRLIYEIAVIDGQGGGIGKHITEKIRREMGPKVEIIALGTNSVATSMMLKAGATRSNRRKRHYQYCRRG